MVDWLYITLPPGTLDKCPGLAFKHTVSDDTGELGDWKEAIHGPFKISIFTNGRTELRGSLHKYWSRSHNGGEFPLWAVSQAIQQLATELEFDPAQAQLHGLEFGANVPMPAPARELLRRAVLHSTQTIGLRTWGGRGCLREAAHQQYFFKAYDKEAQLIDTGHTPPGPLLRIELKARKMEFLKKAGIETLADLTNPLSLQVMGEMLSAHLGKVLFATPGELPTVLRKAERRLLRDGARSVFWEELPKPKLRTQLKQYRQLVAQHITDSALDAATQGLRSTWQQLLHQPSPLSLLATTTEPVAPQINPLSRVLPSPFQEQETAPALHRRAEGLLVALPSPHPLDEGEPSQAQPARRCCQSCGQKLANGRKLSTKFCDKKCRNAASNPGHNARRTLLKIESQPLLFPIREFVRVPEQYRAFVLAAA
jgi:ribosomal protein S14